MVKNLLEKLGKNLYKYVMNYISKRAKRTRLSILKNDQCCGYVICLGYELSGFGWHSYNQKSSDSPRS